MGGRGGGGHGSDDVGRLYREMQKDWGGATVNQNTGAWVPQGIDAYAVTETDTLSIDENASKAEFARAYTNAQSRFGSSPYIGVFHDNAKGTIDFNGTQVVKTTADVDRLFAQGNPVSGGAYHFKTGNGYWPQGRPTSYQPYAA